MSDHGARAAPRRVDERARRDRHARRARGAAVRPARSPSRPRAGRLAPRPRWLARHPTRSVHRGHARRGRFTVDDPRSPRRRSSGRACSRSTAANTAGTATRSRPAFHKPEVAARFDDGSRRRTVTRRIACIPGRAEIRRDLAGPLAVEVVAAALDLLDTEPAAVLGWYDEIVAAVDGSPSVARSGPEPRPRWRTLERHVRGRSSSATASSPRPRPRSVRPRSSRTQRS